MRNRLVSFDVHVPKMARHLPEDSVAREAKQLRQPVWIRRLEIERQA